MITIFNRREICLTYSIKEQTKIRKELSQNKIKYHIKTINRMSPSSISRGTRRMGAVGQDMNLNYEYIIYVHKKDCLSKVSESAKAMKDINPIIRQIKNMDESE